MIANRLIWMSFIALGGLAQSGGVQAQAAIKFGFVSSLSGPFTPWGIQVRDGMKMAMEELNAKGGRSAGSSS